MEQAVQHTDDGEDGQRIYLEDLHLHLRTLRRAAAPLNSNRKPVS